MSHALRASRRRIRTNWSPTNAREAWRNTRQPRNKQEGKAGTGSRAAAPKEQPAKKSRRAVSKRSHGSTSKGEPIPKKARREPEAEASMPEVVPSGVEGQREEEEEEIPLLHPRGLRSRGPMILEEGELAGEPIMAEEAERPEVDLVGRDDVEIPGVSTQPGSSSSVQGRRDEVQQPGSPTVLMPSSRVVDPSPTTGVLGGKVSIAETSRVELSSSSSEEHGYYSGDEVDFGDEPALPDTSKFLHISEEEIQGCDPMMVLPIATIAAAEGTLLVFLNRFPL